MNKNNFGENKAAKMIFGMWLNVYTITVYRVLQRSATGDRESEYQIFQRPALLFVLNPTHCHGQ